MCDNVRLPLPSFACFVRTYGSRQRNSKAHRTQRKVGSKKSETNGHLSAVSRQAIVEADVRESIVLLRSEIEARDLVRMLPAEDISAALRPLQ